jgi:hypothetical protein
MGGGEIPVRFGVSISRETPKPERTRNSGRHGRGGLGGKVQREGPDGRDKEMRLSRDTVGDSCSFELGQGNGRSEKIAANRNDFMEAGWWSKRGSSHAGRVSAPELRRATVGRSQRGTWNRPLVVGVASAARPPTENSRSNVASHASASIIPPRNKEEWLKGRWQSHINMGFGGGILRD